MILIRNLRYSEASALFCYDCFTSLESFVTTSRFQDYLFYFCKKFHQNFDGILVNLCIALGRMYIFLLFNEYRISFHLFVCSSISFIILFSFSVHMYFIPSLNSFPKIFLIIFEGDRDIKISSSGDVKYSLVMIFNNYIPLNLLRDIFWYYHHTKQKIII